jgi:sialic acid synthase SpsE
MNDTPAFSLVGTRQHRFHPASTPYVIAEIGSNHDQDLGKAKALIHMAAECGADAVKFQSLNLHKQYAPEAKIPAMTALFDQIALDETWYTTLAETAHQAGVDFCSAPTYMEALPLLEAVNVPFYKVASPQLRTFPSLLKRVALLGKPMVLSVGYCSQAHIDAAMGICQAAGNTHVVLLHCVSEYPTDYAKVNLRCMNALGERYGCLIGVSDHTPGIEIPVAAVARGAVVIEKHVTFSRQLPGPDHFFALEPQELKAMVQAVHHTHAALGVPEKIVTTHEAQFSQQLLVRWHANTAIPAGTRLTADHLTWLRGSAGISDEYADQLGHLRTTQPLAEGEAITWDAVTRDFVGTPPEPAYPALASQTPSTVAPPTHREESHV